MQSVIRADLHALSATNATGEEVLFIERPGRAQQAFMVLCGESGSAARQRNQGSARSQSGQDFPSLQVCTHCFLSGKKLESQAVLRTLIHAIQTQVALGLMPTHATDRVVAALAAQKTAIAILAMLGILYQPKHGPARDYAQQRT